MALREKISSFAVGAASKANSLAVEAAAKANLAIENSKLNLKIGNEEKKIDTFTVSIGELILDKLDGGETFDDEIMALYSSIQASRETITNARAAIEANNRQAESAHLCAACGAPLAENAKVLWYLRCRSGAARGRDGRGAARRPHLPPLRRRSDPGRRLLHSVRRKIGGGTCPGRDAGRIIPLPRAS